MTQETFRTAYNQAHSELADLQEQFERLRLKKEQIETVVAALKPFVDLHAENVAADFQTSDSSIYMIHENAEASHEPIQNVVEPTPEPIVEPVEYTAELSPEPIQYAPEPSSDPFQRRIESVLWGWSQKREGMAPAV
ncbi:MAG: hypothetical protein WAM85_12225 [Terracidiphilus sp.]